MPPTSGMRIAYLTAGAAGMYCGSCLHDNTLAAAMNAAGADVTLIPLYTPIRTDETDVSIDRVFFGGINVYLQEHFALFRHLPRLFDRWLDWPWLIRRVSQRGIRIEADEVGALTVSMLRGERGRQRKEVRRLVDWLKSEIRPQLVNFSNILIAGMAETVRRRLDSALIVTLQGDDLFLGELKEPFKSQALAEVRRIAADIDGFLVHTNFYADFMSDMLSVPREKFHVVPLGLNADDLLETRGASLGSGDGSHENRPPTVGYLARLAPEKGLDILVEAFEVLEKMPGMENARLHVAGWLSAADRDFYDQLSARIRGMRWHDRFEYFGVVDREGKRRFLQSLDVLSVPTRYRDPKGLFVLESLAAGTPVIQPDHGAFPEMLAATGGGLLSRPNDPAHLAELLFQVLNDENLRRRLSLAGREAVREKCSAERMARGTLQVFEKLAAAGRPAPANPAHPARQSHLPAG